MARRKVRMAWIANDYARKSTLKKRRNGLMKKTRELSVLCDVKSCAVVYSPGECKPEVWPPEEETAKDLLTSFKNLPEMEKSRKMLNQEGFLRQRIFKVQEQLHKLEKENRESRTHLLMLQGLDGSNGSRMMHALTIEDIASLLWLLEEKAKLVEDRINHLMMIDADLDADAYAAAAALVAVNNDNNNNNNNIICNTNNMIMQQQPQQQPQPHDYHHHHHHYLHHQQQEAPAPGPAAMGQEMIQTPTADWYMNAMMMMNNDNNHPANYPSNDINPSPPPLLLPPPPPPPQVAHENVANGAAPMQQLQYAAGQNQHVDPYLESFFSNN